MKFNEFLILYWKKNYFIYYILITSLVNMNNIPSKISKNFYYIYKNYKK